MKHRRDISCECFFLTRTQQTVKDFFNFCLRCIVVLIKKYMLSEILTTLSINKINNTILAPAYDQV